MNSKVELRKTRDFGEIINDTFVFIAQNWKPLLKAYVTICGFFIVASLIFSILNQVKMTTYMNPGSPFQASPGAPYAALRMFGWEYFLAIVFALLSLTSIYLTTLSYMILYREKGNIAPSPEEIWSYFKFYFLRVLGGSVLVWIGLAVGFVLCLIPGIYLLPAFSLVIPVIVFENSTVGFAFSRSFTLIKDNYWSTLGVIVISAIILYVAMAAFILPLSVLNVGSVLVGGHKLNTTYLVLTVIVSHICQAFYMMPTIAISLCYFSLAEQKDNTGLLDRINNLGNPDQLDPLDDQAPSEEY